MAAIILKYKIKYKIEKFHYISLYKWYLALNYQTQKFLKLAAENTLQV